MPGGWLGWDIAIEGLLGEEAARVEAAREETARKYTEEAVRRMALEGLIAYMPAVKRARTNPWVHRKQNAKVKDALLASALLGARAEAI